MFLQYEKEIVFVEQNLTLFLAKPYQYENVSYRQLLRLNLKELNRLMRRWCF
jgi:hypothetical protein